MGDYPLSFCEHSFKYVPNECFFDKAPGEHKLLAGRFS